MIYLFPGVERCRALIVDSNSTTSSIVAGQLRDVGFGAVVQCRRPQDARIQLELQPFDLILCDYHFEHTELTGQELIDDWRRHQLLPYSTTLMMMTSEAAYNMVAEVAEAAVDGYLIRPYSGKTLGERIVLARKRKIDLKPIYDAIENGQWLDAARLCVQRFLNQDSHADQAARMGGELLLSQGKFKDAGTLYQKVLDTQPNLAWARMGQARVSVEMQQSAQARRILEDLVRQQPGQAEALDMLTGLLVEQGELDAATQTCQRAWEQTPSSIVRSARFGTLCFYNGPSSSALRPLERAVTLGQKSRTLDPQAITLLALLRLDDQDAKGVRRCLSLLEQALEKQAESTRLRRMHAIVEAALHLAERRDEAAEAQVQQLSEQFAADDLDVEGTCNVLSLLARLPQGRARAERDQQWVEQLVWRFGGTKAAAQLMLGASAPLAEQQEQVQAIQEQAQHSIETALTHTVAGDPRHTVTELVQLASKWRNAKWADMARLVLLNHRSKITDAERLLAHVESMQAELGTATPRLPLGLNSGRSAQGLRLRPPQSATQST